MTTEQKRTIEVMRGNGKGYKLIAKELGLTRDQVRSYCKKTSLLGVRGYVEPKVHKPLVKRMQCARCSKEFENRRKVKYCSDECRKPIQVTHQLVCKECSKVFSSRKKDQKYCSRNCMFPEKDCEGCGKTFRANHTDRKYCSVRCINIKRRKSHEQFFVEFTEVHKGNIVPLELYQGSDIEMKALCLHCGNEMKRIARHYIGSYKFGCPHCNTKSHGENRIAEWLDNRGIKNERQYKFDDLRYQNTLFYDFMIEKDGEIAGLIEYDGEQHYKSIDFFGGEEKLKITAERDELKTAYAKEINVPLLRISYLQKEEIEKILSDWFTIPPLSG